MFQVHAPRDVLNIARRRSGRLAFLLLLGLAATLALAVLWPPTYRSVATILIEEPNFQQDLLGSAADSYADQRIQIIAQRIMTTANLLSVIERLDLYKEDRVREAASQVAKTMRKRINLELVTAEGIDPRNSRRIAPTIAFTLSFDYRDPETAQDALQALVTLYLDENSRMQRERVADTVTFLRSETEKLRLTVDRSEAKLAAFKEQYADQLPDQIAVKLSQREQVQRELQDAAKRLQALDEKRIYLTAQMAKIDPADAPPKDPTQWTAADRLRALQSEYLTLSSRYGPDHPDVQKVSRELETLEAQVQGGGGRAVLVARRDELRAQLSLLTGTYSSEHPEVLKVRRELDAVEAKLAKAPTETTSTNPALIQLDAELAAAGAEYRALVEQGKARQDLLTRYDDDIRQAPQVEREYRALMREYEGAVAGYTDMLAKQRQAELDEAMESQQRTEQFGLLEAPTLPLEPVAPNLLVVAVAGTVLSLTLAIGSAVVSEAMDYSVYGSRQLTEIAGVPPLVVIPRIRTVADTVRAWKIGATSVAAGVAVIAILFVLSPDLRHALGNFLGLIEDRASELDAYRSFKG